jgi:hypothetical protein
MNCWQRFLSHSLDCLFILLIVSFDVQKLFNLMQPPFWILVFTSWAIGVQALPVYGYIFKFFPYDLFLVVVLSFTLRSLIHFELNFIRGKRGLVSVSCMLTTSFPSSICGNIIFVNSIWNLHHDFPITSLFDLIQAFKPVELEDCTELSHFLCAFRFNVLQ